MKIRTLSLTSRTPVARHKGHHKKTTSYIWIMASLLCAGAAEARAATDEVMQFFAEEAEVTTASRRPQSIQEAPVAMEVITAEEIKASGAVNIWDLFRFRPGMDVMDGHQTVLGNRAILSIRGFAEAFARNMLVLVDGRRVYSTDSGGVYWAQLPISVQDIDHIEIVRGPNAALYGTGAGLGVINIFTKKASGSTGATLQGAGGNQNTWLTSDSVESSIKGFDFRVNYDYLQQGAFDTLMAGGPTQDYLHTNKVTARLYKALASGSDLELFAGGSWNTSGIPNAQAAQDKFMQSFEMLKFHMKISDASSLEFTTSHNYYSYTINPTATTVSPVQDHLINDRFDEEIVHRIDWGEGRFNTVSGVSYYITKVDSQHTFLGHPSQDDQVGSLFLNQTVHVIPQVTLVGAVAAEWYRDNHPHPNYQVAALWTPVENQTFRASYSVAHTIPSIRQRFVNEGLNPFVARVGNPNLQPETLTSYEVGYRGGWLEHHMETEANLFFTRIGGIDDDVDLGPWPNDPSVTALGFVNANQAIAEGAELQVKYKLTARRSVYVNYTFEHITDKSGNAGEVTDNTPAHKLNLGGMADFGDGFSASFNLGYKDHYFVTNVITDQSVPAYWRLDARLAYSPPWYKHAEVYVAGQNLLRSQHVEYADGLQVPLTWQGGMTLQF